MVKIEFEIPDFLPKEWMDFIVAGIQFAVGTSTGGTTPPAPPRSLPRQKLNRCLILYGMAIGCHLAPSWFYGFSSLFLGPFGVWIGAILWLRFTVGAPTSTSLGKELLLMLLQFNVVMEQVRLSYTNPLVVADSHSAAAAATMRSVTGAADSDWSIFPTFDFPGAFFLTSLPIAVSLIYFESLLEYTLSTFLGNTAALIQLLLCSFGISALTGALGLHDSTMTHFLIILLSYESFYASWGRGGVSGDRILIAYSGIRRYQPLLGQLARFMEGIGDTLEVVQVMLKFSFLSDIDVEDQTKIRRAGRRKLVLTTALGGAGVPADRENDRDPLDVTFDEVAPFLRFVELFVLITNSTICNTLILLSLSHSHLTLFLGLGLCVGCLHLPSFAASETPEFRLGLLRRLSRLMQWFEGWKRRTSFPTQKLAPLRNRLNQRMLITDLQRTHTLLNHGGLVGTELDAENILNTLWLSRGTPLVGLELLPVLLSGFQNALRRDTTPAHSLLRTRLLRAALAEMPGANSGVARDPIFTTAPPCVTPITFQLRDLLYDAFSAFGAMFHTTTRTGLLKEGSHISVRLDPSWVHVLNHFLLASIIHDIIVGPHSWAFRALGLEDPAADGRRKVFLNWILPYRDRLVQWSIWDEGPKGAFRFPPLVLHQLTFGPQQAPDRPPPASLQTADPPIHHGVLSWLSSRNVSARYLATLVKITSLSELPPGSNQQTIPFSDDECVKLAVDAAYLLVKRVPRNQMPPAHGAPAAGFIELIYTIFRRLGRDSPEGRDNPKYKLLFYRTFSEDADDFAHKVVNNAEVHRVPELMFQLKNLHGSNAMGDFLVALCFLLATVDTIQDPATLYRVLFLIHSVLLEAKERPAEMLEHRLPLDHLATQLSAAIDILQATDDAREEAIKNGVQESFVEFVLSSDGPLLRTCCYLAIELALQSLLILMELAPVPTTKGIKAGRGCFNLLVHRYSAETSTKREPEVKTSIRHFAGRITRIIFDRFQLPGSIYTCPLARWGQEPLPDGRPAPSLVDQQCIICFGDLHSAVDSTDSKKGASESATRSTQGKAGSSDEIAMVLKCQHKFHRRCISMWMLNHQQCPVCREEIDMQQPAPIPFPLPHSAPPGWMGPRVGPGFPMGHQPAAPAAAAEARPPDSGPQRAPPVATAAPTVATGPKASSSVSSKYGIRPEPAQTQQPTPSRVPEPAPVLKGPLPAQDLD
jgi:hypothetical protein